MEIRLGLLYPHHTGLYGDRGNAMIFRKRAERQGVSVKVEKLGTGDWPSLSGLDLLLGGGAQDCDQEIIQADLLGKKEDLAAAVRDGLPFLAVCGTYQLLGHYYQTVSGERLPGLGLLDLVTVAEPGRLVGNVSLQTYGLDLPHPTLTGFENHSGRTYLGKVKPLGFVVHGYGNNGRDGTEGAIWLNCIGTYLHGPILAQNPHLADYFLDRALNRRYGANFTSPIDDLEVKAHRAAWNRR